MRTAQLLVPGRAEFEAERECILDIIMLQILGVQALTDAGGGMAPPFEVYLEQQSDAAPKFFTDFDGQR